MLIILITLPFYSSPTFCTVPQITTYLWFLKASGDLYTIIFVKLSPSWILSHQRMHTDTHFTHNFSLFPHETGWLPELCYMAFLLLGLRMPTPTNAGSRVAEESYQDAQL